MRPFAPTGKLPAGLTIALVLVVGGYLLISQLRHGSPESDPAPPGLADAVAVEPAHEALAERPAVSPVLDRASGNVEVATDRRRRYADRQEALINLPSALSSDDLAVLVAFLSEPPAYQLHSAGEERALANEVMNLLRDQTPPIPNLAEILGEVFLNEELDEVVRDYAVQHLGAWHKNAPEEERPFIVTVLTAGLEKRGSSIAGTSLLALRRLDPDDSSGDSERLGAVAVEIAADSRASRLSRITALQVAADLQARAVAPVAVEIALDEWGSYPLRLSAIAALQRLGGPEAERVLAQVEELQDPYLLAAFRQKTVP